MIPPPLSLHPARNRSRNFGNRVRVINGATAISMITAISTATGIKVKRYRFHPMRLPLNRCKQLQRYPQRRNRDRLRYRRKFPHLAPNSNNLRHKRRIPPITLICQSGRAATNSLNLSNRTMRYNTPYFSVLSFWQSKSTTDTETKSARRNISPGRNDARSFPYWIPRQARSKRRKKSPGTIPLSFPVSFSLLCVFASLRDTLFSQRSDIASGPAPAVR